VPSVTRESEPTVVVLGRLVAMKRPDDAIEAFKILPGRWPTALLWVIGNGPLFKRLRIDHFSRSHVSWGRVPSDELRTRLARAHVLVTTSVREGWSLNVSEAAACGTSSIGYGVPGLVDS
jgi:glycosyltransferase involved in cell wall biosynthesis